MSEQAPAQSGFVVQRLAHICSDKHIHIISGFICINKKVLDIVDLLYTEHLFSYSLLEGDIRACDYIDKIPCLAVFFFLS